MTAAVLLTVTITMESRARIENGSTPFLKDRKARKSSPCFQTFKLLCAELPSQKLEWRYKCPSIISFLEQNQAVDNYPWQ